MSDITAKLIGTIPPADAGRDAIHVAVVPVVAAEILAAGQKVGLTPDGKARSQGTVVGVVDPFLPGFVNKGERFFLFLPPGSITSLRHVWTHPSFGDEPTNDAPAKPAPKLVDVTADVAAARKWLEGFAPKFELDYDGLMQAARDYLNNGDYVIQEGAEGWRDTFYNRADEFWRNYEIVTGEPVENRGHFFSCSC